MRGSGYARFMELRGRTIVEGAGALWYSVSGRLLMPVRYHVPISPDRDELRAMLRAARFLGARFASTGYAGLPKGLYVHRDKTHSIEAVHPNARRAVRRGLRECEVRPAAAAELIDQGLRANRETMQRQGRYDAEFGEAKRWRRLVEAAARCAPEITILGAFVGKRLAAHAVLWREDGWLHILHQFSLAELLHYRPNDALCYTVTKAGAEDSGIEAVCYGLTGLVDTEGLHRFKLHHGHRVEELNDSFVLHPAAESALASGPAAWLVRLARRLRPRDQTLERVESVITGACRTRRGLREVTA